MIACLVRGVFHHAKVVEAHKLLEALDPLSRDPDRRFYYLIPEEDFTFLTLKYPVITEVVAVIDISLPQDQWLDKYNK